MATQSLPTSGTASTNGTGTSWSSQQGALNKIVLQTVNYEGNDSEGTGCRATLKSSYKQLVTLVGTGLIGKTWTEILAASEGLDTSLEQMAPQTNDLSGWTCKNYDLRQGEDGSGIHAVLELDFGFSSDQPGGGGGELPNSETWSLAWQPESWDVYRYCANEGLSALPASNAQLDKTKTADSIHIQQYLDQSQDTMKEQDDWYYKSSVNSELFMLNYAERLVAKKKMAQLQPIFHIPVINKSTSYVSNADTLPTISSCGDGLDEIQPLPDGCPFSFEDSAWGVPWQWIKTGDTINMSRDKANGTTTYTRTEQWTGAISADINFYGTTPWNHNTLEDCRWKFGAV